MNSVEFVDLFPQYKYNSIMSHQQGPFSSRRLADVNYAYRQKVVPTDLTGHQFIHAHNVKFTDNLSNVASDFIMIDSCMRNWNKEEPNSYTISLNNELNDVYSLELVDGFVPSSGYNVNQYNNRFYFQETTEQVSTGTYYVVEVPIGNYEIDDLLNIIRVQMESVGLSNYTLTNDANTNRVTVETDDEIGTGIFNLIFTTSEEIIGERGYIETLEIDETTGKKVRVKKETGSTRNSYIDRSIGRTLGFKPENLSGSLSYTGQYIFTLRPSDFLAIFVENEARDDFSLIECSNDAVKGAFAIVPLLTSSEGFVAGNLTTIVDNAVYRKTFNPPINIKRLKIEFRNCDGHLYDFNGINNSLVFEVKRVYQRELIGKLDQLR